MSDDSDLQSKYKRYSTLAERIALLIILGLLIEIGAVFYLHKPFDEAVLTITASALIVAGVWGELLLEKRAKEAGDGIVAQANARASEANQKAQEAALELARFREPRVFTREQMYRISEKLKAYAGIQFAGATSGRDPEFLNFLQFIETSLMLAEWREVGWPISSGITRVGKTTIGTDVSVSNALVTFPMNAMGKGMEDASVALADALVAEGFAAKAGLDERDTGMILLMIGPKR